MIGWKVWKGVDVVTFVVLVVDDSAVNYLRSAAMRTISSALTISASKSLGAPS